MVEYKFDLDLLFSSLSDPTRRDILKRVSKCELSINELAEPYDVSLAAVSKHVQVLEKAQLIYKKRVGTHQYIAASPPALHQASMYLQQYQALWENKFERLDKLLEKEIKPKKHGKK